MNLYGIVLSLMFSDWYVLPIDAHQKTSVPSDNPDVVHAHWALCSVEREKEDAAKSKRRIGCSCVVGNTLVTVFDVSWRFLMPFLILDLCTLRDFLVCNKECFYCSVRFLKVGMPRNTCSILERWRIMFQRQIVLYPQTAIKFCPGKTC